MKKFDFSGWATRNNLKCSDGRTILKDAFKDNDGQTVPLVWNHQHNGPFNVLGHALLENRADGVYAYCTFNDTEQGRNAKLLVEHGDVSALSIFANQLRERASNVLHGAIREVSLVLAGANPGAFIDTVALSHGDDADGEAIIYTGEPISLYHSDTKKEDEDGGSDNPDDKDKNPNKKDGEDDETIEDVIKTFNKKQKDVFYAVVGEIMSQKDVPDDKKKEEEKKGGNETMKHNVFDQKQARTDILSHADGEAIISLAKNNQVGSLQTALQIYADENNLTLQHDATSSGFVQTGDGNVTLLFPEYKDVRPGAPELITSDQGWISVVMRKVHKSPISRIRTGQVDIRNIDALRAKGYEKGKEKKLTGNFKLVRRTTDPQTVYVKNALHRDDIVDITDLDYVQYLYNIDRMMLNEELATAIMLGDGRDEGDADKISPEHIRPIWLDDDLYTLHVDLDVEAAKKELQGTNTGVSFGLNYILAEALINTVLYAREKYKGTGTPDFFCTPHMLNVMLLARDMNGRRIYSSKAELASSLGATKGGEVTHFTQFDIDFNQEKSLLETRCSGALTRVYSAIAIEEPVEELG